MTGTDRYVNRMSVGVRGIGREPYSLPDYARHVQHGYI